MRLTIAYSKMEKRNLVLINNETYQRETLSERPIRQPLISFHRTFTKVMVSNFGAEQSARLSIHGLARLVVAVPCLLTVMKMSNLQHIKL